MITWFKIALRNLLKNRRRSIITALAIALGFAAVNLFGGFTEYMYTGNREGVIYGRSQGTSHDLQERVFGKRPVGSGSLLVDLGRNRCN